MCFLFFATCAVELVQLPFPHSQMLVIARPPDFHLDPATVFTCPISPASQPGQLRFSKEWFVPGQVHRSWWEGPSSHSKKWKFQRILRVVSGGMSSGPCPERVKRSWLQLANACWFSPPVVDLFNCAGGDWRMCLFTSFCTCDGYRVSVFWAVSKESHAKGKKTRMTSL